MKSVSRKVYPHTKKALSYQSLISIKDTHLERSVLISMNKPFRYKNHTFFQSSYSENSKNEKFSTLAVSHNPFAFLPYISTVIIVLGLFLHFCLQMKRGLIGRLILIFSCLSLQSSLWADLSSDFFKKWKALPVMHKGRLKPLETLARNQLLIFSGKTKRKTMTASEWLFKVIVDPSSVENEAIFQSNNPQIFQSLGIMKKHKRYCSFKELQQREELFHSLVEKVRNIEAEERDLLDKEYLRLWLNYLQYKKWTKTLSFTEKHPLFSLSNSDLIKSLSLPKKDGYSFYDLLNVLPNLNKNLQKVLSLEKKKISASESDIISLSNSIVEWIQEAKTSPLKIFYVKNHPNHWLDPMDLLKERVSLLFVQKRLESLFALKTMFLQKNWERCNQCLDGIYASNAQDWKSPSQYRKLSLENLYNAYRPMLWVKSLSVLLLLLSLLFFIFPFLTLRFVIKTLTLCLFLVHLFGIILRMMILSRPPVSNLYETFIFVAFLSLIIGVFIECFQKKGFGFFIGAFLEFVVMNIASSYALQGDTLQVLQAVLRSHFWLSTHVVAITIGYSFSLVTGLMGHIFLLKMLFQKKDPPVDLSFLQSLYGILGFALLFSFLGTLLGGIWADQSWGRFWGWDPKENGALLIILWCSLIFHAKHGDMIKEWGFSVLCACLPIFVALAWFGINLLGVGLHSYGFSDGVAFYLYLFIFSEIVFLFVMSVLRRLLCVPI